jgi:hypothetical protein
MSINIKKILKFKLNYIKNLKENKFFSLKSLY